jgi:hypothetical protein
VTKPKTRSGPSMSYSDRKAKGRPTVSVTMATDTIELLAKLAEHYGLSRAAVVELALRELSKKVR